MGARSCVMGVTDLFETYFMVATEPCSVSLGALSIRELAVCESAFFSYLDGLIAQSPRAISGGHPFYGKSSIAV
jgi:hypothetical protein